MLQTKSISTKVFFKSAIEDLKIDANRFHLLEKIALGILKEYRKNNKVNLNYICTHNSRRSQLSQVWSSYASNYFNLNSIYSFSGGTSVTAFYRNTVKTLQETGFIFKIEEFSHSNPKYLISFDGCNKPIKGFSKLYDSKENKKPFIAITTCSNADENCPFIPDAIQRFHLPFIDPKSSDGTKNQAEKYLETNKQIAGEIHTIFKIISGSI
jgi:arsenate reductase